MKPARQKVHDLQVELEAKKTIYDSTAAGLESSMVKLEVDVKRGRSEVEKLESSNFLIDCELEVAEAISSMVESETKVFVSTDADDKSSSIQ